MNKGTAATLTLLLFGIALAADLVFTFLDAASLRIISKPLIVLSLTGYFLFSTNALLSPLKGWVIGGLLFSWLGDVLLLFESRSSLFFILGLGSFLLAQVAYAVFFNSLRKQDGRRLSAPLFLIALVYYATLIITLYPHLGGMKVPVMVYGLVISLMLVTALHLAYVRQKKGALAIILGAVLFVLSDSLLAINKFFIPFAGAGVLIMLTYGMAQFFIVSGSILALQNQYSGNAKEREEGLYNDRHTD